jgi:mono/diheme cytochrome c family protein
MRFLFLFMLIVSAAMVPQMAFSEQAKTIDELVSSVDSSQCAGCHSDIHDNWSKSWHAKSVTDPRSLRTFRTFILKGIDKNKKPAGAKRTMLRDMCLKCHAPAALGASDELAEQIAGLVVTAVDDKDASKKEAAIKELSKLDINCITCHGVRTPGGLVEVRTTEGLVEGKLPAPPEPNTIFGPGDAKNPPHKDAIGFNTIKSENMKKSEFCMPCHHGCPPGMSSKECPTQWTVYQEHYIAHGGKQTCQDCHMQGKGGASHRFPGIYEKEFAATAIDLTLSATPTRHYDHLEDKMMPAIVMNVKLKNNSPHDLPHG